MGRLRTTTTSSFILRSFTSAPHPLVQVTSETRWRRAAPRPGCRGAEGLSRTAPKSHGAPTLPPKSGNPRMLRSSFTHTIDSGTQRERSLTSGLHDPRTQLRPRPANLLVLLTHFTRSREISPPLSPSQPSCPPNVRRWVASAERWEFARSERSLATPLHLHHPQRSSASMTGALQGTARRLGRRNQPLESATGARTATQPPPTHPTHLHPQRPQRRTQHSLVQTPGGDE